MSESPLVLVTNDDGIQSGFLEALVTALATRFRVVVAAPASEQSWIGRAMSRRQELTVRPQTVAGCEGWAIDGTPTDCVNLALGHLLPVLPDLVVSGINIGYNTTLPLLLSSGTIAGALEGAHWGLPAIAVSMAVAGEDFEAVTQNNARDLPPHVARSLAAAAAQAAHFAAELTREPNTRLMVENLNFPAETTATTPLRRTVPGQLALGTLYAAVEGRADGYAFRYQTGTLGTSAELTDRQALLEGFGSWSRLEFGRLGYGVD